MSRNNRGQAAQAQAVTLAQSLVMDFARYCPKCPLDTTTRLLRQLAPLVGLYPLPLLFGKTGPNKLRKYVLYAEPDPLRYQKLVFITGYLRGGSAAAGQALLYEKEKVSIDHDQAFAYVRAYTKHGLSGLFLMGGHYATLFREYTCRTLNDLPPPPHPPQPTTNTGS